MKEDSYGSNDRGGVLDSMKARIDRYSPAASNEKCGNHKWVAPIVKTVNDSLCGVVFSYHEKQLHVGWRDKGKVYSDFISFSLSPQQFRESVRRVITFFTFTPDLTQELHRLMK